MTPSDRITKNVNEVKKMGFNPVSWQFVIAVKAFSAMSISTWEKKVEVYKKWGCSEDEILVAFGKYPWCMMASVHKITRVMEFFVNKMEKALSASKNVNFETPDRPNSVIALFENHGFSKTQISKLVMMLPRVLLSDPKKTLLPKLEFFKSKCDSSSDVAKLLSSEPTILKRSLENQIIPSFNILKKFMGSEEELIYCIKRFARVLVYDLQVFVIPNIEIMREAGVPNANIVSFFKYHPKRFMTPSDRFTKNVNEVKKMGFSPVSWQFVIAVKAFSAMSISTWEKKVEVYKKWGCSED
ncbi:hypothetical protein TEA_018516 [Camellia sinensis var. sinensis]|uniref:Uncharacterized protein n=1 Tax=Camellia sinensis var. sinensis TaxID=542762 RepID=A0A4S4EXR3_CAMSN|nr:hypothetical protein TEA_018516 [Camellia sinensis var. sinensis]